MSKSTSKQALRSQKKYTVWFEHLRVNDGNKLAKCKDKRAKMEGASINDKIMKEDKKDGGYVNKIENTCQKLK